MSKSKPILLIDANNLSHRAYHTHQLSHKGKSVSMIYGVPSMVRSLISKFRPKKVIMVWDGAKRKERLKLTPGYKSHRKLNTKDRIDLDDFIRQKEVVMEILSELGIKQVRHPKMEADDYIYMLSQKYMGNVIICSNDKDFHQLICPGISQFMDKEKLREEITHINFQDHFDMTPNQHIDYLCLVGDSTDDIEGYRGIGPVKALKFLKEHHSILDYLEGPDEIKALDKKKLEAIYKRNQMMIDLEMFYMTHLQGKIKIRYIYKDREHIPAVYQELCQKHGLKTFAKQSFINSFKL